MRNGILGATLAALVLGAACPALATGNLDLKVAVVTFNPWMTNVAELATARRLNEVFNWAVGYEMALDHVQWWKEASHGMVKCQLVTNVVLDVWPHFQGGHALTPQSYYNLWVYKVSPGFSTSFTFDSDYFLTQQCPWITDYVNRGVIDQVWLYGFPECGCYETQIHGWGASYCNSPGHGATDSERLFMMNMPSVERPDTPMENFGHGAECVIGTRWYNGGVEYAPATDYSGKSDFVLFTQNYATDPNNIQVGNIHYAPNSTSDYQWGSKNKVLSYADNWYGYPDLSGEPRLMDCTEWGNGINHLHKIWWFRHLPQKVGLHRGQMMNWVSVYLNLSRAAHPLGINEEIQQQDADFGGFFPFYFDLPAGTTQAVVTIRTDVPVESGLRKRYVPSNSRYWEDAGTRPGYDAWRTGKSSQQSWTLNAANSYGQALTGRWYVTFGRAYGDFRSRPTGDSGSYSVSLAVSPQPAPGPALKNQVLRPAPGDIYVPGERTVEWSSPGSPVDGWESFSLSYSTNYLAGPFTEICEDYAYELRSPYRWLDFPAGVTSACARVRLIAKDRHGNACTNYSGLFGMNTEPVPEPAWAGLLLGLLAGLIRSFRR